MVATLFVMLGTEGCQTIYCKLEGAQGMKKPVMMETMNGILAVVVVHVVVGAVVVAGTRTVVVGAVVVAGTRTVVVAGTRTVVVRGCCCCGNEDCCGRACCGEPRLLLWACDCSGDNNRVVNEEEDADNDDDDGWDNGWDNGVGIRCRNDNDEGGDKGPDCGNCSCNDRCSTGCFEDA